MVPIERQIPTGKSVLQYGFAPFLIQSLLPDDDERVVTLMECGALGRVTTKTLLGDVERALKV